MIEYSRQTAKFLQKAEKETTERILKSIEELENEPLPSGIKKIKGTNENVFRIRVGDYRVLYEIDKENIGIIRINHRKKAYR